LRKHPVVHVAFEDAMAYAKWTGKTLPSEAQWEFAARGGLEQAEFVWGNEFAPDGKMMANTWQGEFPWQNHKTDGYEWTAPVGTYLPNSYGLYDMAGNVWEWTQDWFRPQHDKPIKSCCTPVNPRVTSPEQSYDPNQQESPIPRRVTKGGSYLCAPNYCYRYRPSARQPEAIDTSTCHIGFRCVVNV
jgi:formylglycine-generating enzyme required for sulfatase activity